MRRWQGGVLWEWRSNYCYCLSFWISFTVSVILCPLSSLTIIIYFSRLQSKPDHKCWYQIMTLFGDHPNSLRVTKTRHLVGSLGLMFPDQLPCFPRFKKSVSKDWWHPSVWTVTVYVPSESFMAMSDHSDWSKSCGMLCLPFMFI